jgi:dienelactone hydrolase
MDFTAETVADGVLERAFSLEVGAERVPGVVWSRATKDAPDRPIVLFGHGGRLHKKIPYLFARAHKYVTAFGYTVVAIDAPNHGERPVSERAVRVNAEMAQRLKERKPIADLLGRELELLTEQAVPEWKATLDAVQALPEVGSGGRVGYWGMSMGGAIGVSLVAAEPRIRAAVLGLIGLVSSDHPIAKAAAQLTVPIEFVLQWHDEVVSRESGLALFNAIASPEKALHINPGKHVENQRHLLDVPIDAA